MSAGSTKKSSQTGAREQLKTTSIQAKLLLLLALMCFVPAGASAGSLKEIAASRIQRIGREFACFKNGAGRAQIAQIKESRRRGTRIYYRLLIIRQSDAERRLRKAQQQIRRFQGWSRSRRLANLTYQSLQGIRLFNLRVLSSFSRCRMLLFPPPVPTPSPIIPAPLPPFPPHESCDDLAPSASALVAPSKSVYQSEIVERFNYQCFRLQGDADVPNATQHYSALREAFMARAIQNHWIAPSTLNPLCTDGTSDFHLAMAIRELHALRLYFETLAPSVCIGNEYTVPLAYTASWLKRLGQLSPSQDQELLDTLVLVAQRSCSYERGPNNLSFGSAINRLIVPTLYPSYYGSPTIAAQANSMVRDWLDYFDIGENSSNYSGVFWDEILAWTELTGQQQLLGSPQMANLLDRFAQQFSPQGPLPAYGDTVGLGQESPAWLGTFEAAAHFQQAGRYKFIAMRLHEWLQSHRSDYYLTWGNLADDYAISLMKVYEYLDDSVAVSLPQWGSSVTTRQAFARVFPWEPHDSEAHGELFIDGQVPDKIIFRDRCWSPQSFFILIDAASPTFNHAHEGGGNVAAIYSQNTVLSTAGSGYLIKNAPNLNAFGLTVANQPEQWNLLRDRAAITTLGPLADGRLGASASLSVQNYRGLGAGDLNRQFLVAKSAIGGDGILWVRDKFIATSSGSFRTGPIWQALQLQQQEQFGSLSRFRIAAPAIPLPQIWTLSNLMSWSNGNAELDLTMTGSAASTTTLRNVSINREHLEVNQDLQNANTTSVSQNLQRNFTPGQQESFDSILVVRESAASTRTTTILQSDPNLTIVRVSLDRPEDFLLLGMNDSGELVTLADGSFRTNARRFVLRIQSGEVTNYWLAEASRLEHHDYTLVNAPERQPVLERY